MSVIVRKVRCPSCSAPKITKARTAYVYCDYCGQLMDWDVTLVNATRGHKPGWSDGP